MSRPATNRLKVNPQLGRMPTLQFCRPAELRIDAGYQRDVSNGSSQALIRRIAQHWNWDLCQPLVVARRSDLTERLFVIDGQHRLEAARLRGDIDQLPCVIVGFASSADEAASFVHLNQQRRSLTKLDLFKAAVASDDTEACAIVAAMTEAGLSVAPHSNYTAWKPGMVQNIGGIEAAWRRHGPMATRAALRALAAAYPGRVLQYAGTLFPGIAAVCADHMVGRAQFDTEGFERLVVMLGARSQTDWRGDVLRAKADYPLLKFDGASAKVILAAWERATGRAPEQPKATAAASPRPVPPPMAAAPAAPAAPLGAFPGQRWCEQCDMRVAHAQAAGCKSRHCSLRRAAA